MQTLPDFSRVLLELAVFIVIEEIGFYYSHRFLKRFLICSKKKILILLYFIPLIPD